MKMLFNGDLMDLVDKIEDESLDLIILDPPYGKEKDIEHDNLSDKELRSHLTMWIGAIVPKLRTGGSLYCFMGYEYYNFVKGILQEHLTLRREIIWWYEQGGLMHGSKNFVAEYDKVLYFIKGNSLDEVTFNEVRRIPSPKTLKTWNPDRLDSDGFIRWEDLSPEMRNNYGNSKKTYIQKRKWKPGRGKPVGSVLPIAKVNPWSTEGKKWKHPTQKPERLIELFIRISSNEGGVVADFFAGTGVTPTVAKRLKRDYIASEIYDKYFAVMEKRVNSIIVEKKIGDYFRKPKKITIQKFMKVD